VLYNVYFPNGGMGEERTKFKLEFCKAFQSKCEELLKEGRHVVIVGDFNTAHQDIDIHCPTIKHSGFLPEERNWMTDFFSVGFVDAFRISHPGEPHCYTWWDQKSNARNANKGWRLDYCVLDRDLAKEKMIQCNIHSDQLGSDHCPVSLELRIDLLCENRGKTLPLSSQSLRKKQSSIVSFFKAEKYRISPVSPHQTTSAADPISKEETSNVCPSRTTYASHSSCPTIIELLRGPKSKLNQSLPDSSVTIDKKRTLLSEDNLQKKSKTMDLTGINREETVESQRNS